MDNLIEYILEGVLDGRQGEKLKTIVPLTNLNMVTQLAFMLDSFLEKEVTEQPILEAYFIQVRRKR